MDILKATHRVFKNTELRGHNNKDQQVLWVKDHKDLILMLWHNILEELEVQDLNGQ